MRGLSLQMVRGLLRGFDISIGEMVSLFNELEQNFRMRKIGGSRILLTRPLFTFFAYREKSNRIEVLSDR